MTEFNNAPKFPIFSYPINYELLGNVWIDVGLFPSSKRGYILDSDYQYLDGFFFDSTGSIGSNEYNILPGQSSAESYFFNRFIDTFFEVMTRTGAATSDRFPNGGFNQANAQITGTYDYSNGTGGFDISRTGWTGQTTVHFRCDNTDIDNVGRLFGFSSNTIIFPTLALSVQSSNPPIGCFHPNNRNPVRTSNIKNNTYVAESIFDNSSYVSKYGTGITIDLYNFDIMPAAYVNLNRASQEFFADAANKPASTGSRHNCVEFMVRSVTNQNNNIQVYTGMTGSNETFRHEYKLRDTSFLQEPMDSGYIEDISGRGQLYNVSIPLVGNYDITKYKF